MTAHPFGSDRADDLAGRGGREADAVPGAAFRPPEGDDDELLTRAARRARRRRSPARTVVEWVLVIGGALIVALLIKAFLLQAFYIPSESMEPTLKVGDRVLVNKLSDDLGDVRRGHIIVFGRPTNEPPSEIDDLIKRVVALPGEVVEGRDGMLYIDGFPLEEPYLPAGTITQPFAPVTVPEGHLFVMGDNRGDSRDSRAFGPIDAELIVGRAVVTVWPLGRVGTL